MPTTELEHPWTPQAATALRNYLNRPEYVIPHGRGTRDAACSIAAINIALYDYPDDTPPLCMSQVIGYWVRTIQDLMPIPLRNSIQWKSALQQAVDTGRDPVREEARMDALADWVYDVALLTAQNAANQCGLGPEWEKARCTRALRDLARVTNIAHPSHPDTLAFYHASEQLISISNRQRCGYQDFAMKVAAIAAIVASCNTQLPDPSLSFAENQARAQSLERAWQELNPAGMLRKISSI